MAAWHLAFTHPDWLSLETCEGLLTTFVDGPVTVEIGELDGNPRDYYARPITITGQRGEVRLVLTTSQAMRAPDDPEPHILSVNVTLSSDTATFATKLETWRALADACAKIGCRDSTRTLGASAIVDEADAAGDTATATALRAEIGAALVDQAAHIASCYIRSPRTDVEPILAAYPRPERIVSFGLTDCGLAALPANFSRFPSIERLTLEEDAFDGSVLRGLSLPQLEWLTLRGKSLRRVTKDDLAGFPNLEVLSCTDSPLEALDPEILEVCPKLIRVYVDDTPLAKNERAMATLRARWPRMLWRYHDGHVNPPRPFAIKPPEPLPAPAVVPKAIDPTLRPFFAAILAAPDDDAPRLQLADFLIARGDRRGEQIRLSCELAKLEVDDPAYAALATRCQVTLPGFGFFSDTRYPFLVGQRPGRGFVEAIECSIRDFLAHADALMQDAPIQEYQIHNSAGEGALLAECPALAKLRRLDLRRLGPDDCAAILASPHLRKTLHELTLSAQLASTASVAVLGRQLAGLTALRRLRLDGTLTESAVPSLVALVEQRGLKQLDLTYCTLKPTSILEPLSRQLGDRLRPRLLPRVPFENGALTLWSRTTPLSVEQIRALLATGDYRGAVKLSVGYTADGNAVLELLATCRAFPALVELQVGGPTTTITDEGVRAFATKAVGLDALATIDLGVAPGGRDPGGINDAAVEALAHAAGLPALTEISRSIEHHVYADDASDQTEVIEIRRDDGRIVKSVIGHFLWP